jgi:hypothetical protein
MYKSFNERILSHPMFEVLKSPEVFAEYQRRLLDRQNWYKAQLIEYLTV